MATQSHPCLTEFGIDYGTEYSDARQDYQEFRGDPAYEDGEVIVFTDDSGYEYNEIARETGRSWEAVNRIFHDVASDRVEDHHTVWSDSWPVVLVKPGVIDG